jgi:hypothetical protein
MSSSWLPTSTTPGAVEHHDQIGHAHGAEAVRHQQVMRPLSPRRAAPA